ncbi:hypothetical protein BaRGS_00010772 [Batillaria attramentaria]|uniref:Uncharacterized protein n=1 Tax=Batillaria attramentaria TaxID=370345 RepID=A0ABD0LEW6_9CAEN
MIKSCLLPIGGLTWTKFLFSAKHPPGSKFTYQPERNHNDNALNLCEERKILKKLNQCTFRTDTCPPLQQRPRHRGSGACKERESRAHVREPPSGARKMARGVCFHFPVTQLPLQPHGAQC